MTPERKLRWRKFLAKTPLSERARSDIARLYEERVDYLPGLSLEEKKLALQRMSYRDFLTVALVVFGAVISIVVVAALCGCVCRVVLNRREREKLRAVHKSLEQRRRGETMVVGA